MRTCFMFGRVIALIIVSAFILLVSELIFAQNISESDTIVINSTNVKTDTGESPAEVFSFKEASIWAYSAHLTLIPDAPPVVDNNAFFITQFQTVIPVSGYKRELMYRIYIDFLRYSQKNVPFNSKLKIFIRDIYGNKREIGAADLTFMSDKKLFAVSIPFDLSYPGKFDIIIHEYSGKTGNWGIWDIIVSSKKLNEIEMIQIDSSEKIKEIEPKIFK